jgi:2-(1,2-epoxy-1,2-dihydrophenyl)acetyl-CoA isomerase
VPDLGGTYRLARLVGLGRATELVLSGRRVGAEEAIGLGLAERAVADADEALDVATQLAAAPGAVKRVPRLLRENLARGRDEALEHELSTQLACISGADFQEAVRAHLEQREPTYTGT